MPQTDPNLGLQYGWTLGESGWNTGMDANLKKLGAVVHLSVKNRTAYTPPTSPANGDRYIIPAGATGDWTGRDGQIAVRINGVWEYYTATVGWVAYVEDENKQVIYTTQGWTLVDDVLELGTAARKNVGTSGDKVPLLNGNNTFSGTTVFGSKVGIGTTPSSNVNRLHISDTITSSTTYSIYAYSEINNPSQSAYHASAFINTALSSNLGNSGNVTSFISNITSYTSNTVSKTKNFDTGLSVLGGGNIELRYGYYGGGLNLSNGTVTNNYVFFASAGNVGAINNYGFYSDIPAGTGRWNFYANGTAENFFKGRTTFNTGFARTPTVSTAPSGSIINLTNQTNHLLYNNASTANSLTINLPYNDVIDGQEITIATRSAITNLMVGAGGRQVYGAPTTLPAGGFATFIYSSVANAWFRKG